MGDGLDNVVLQWCQPTLLGCASTYNDSCYVQPSFKKTFMNRNLANLSCSLIVIHLWEGKFWMPDLRT